MARGTVGLLSTAGFVAGVGDAHGAHIFCLTLHTPVAAPRSRPVEPATIFSIFAERCIGCNAKEC